MLAAQHAGESDTRIVEEMGLWSGAVRIDLAVINGELGGYELKSDRDTLDRLPVQAAMYSRVFDKMNLVVGSRYAGKVRPLIPEWWGITVVTKIGCNLELFSARRCHDNPDPDPLLLARLLWKPECLGILDDIGSARGWRAKPVAALHTRLVEVLPIDQLRERIRKTLKLRPNWLRQPVND